MKRKKKFNKVVFDTLPGLFFLNNFSLKCSFKFQNEKFHFAFGHRVMFLIIVALHLSKNTIFT